MKVMLALMGSLFLFGCSVHGDNAPGLHRNLVYFARKGEAGWDLWADDSCKRLMSGFTL